MGAPALQHGDILLTCHGAGVVAVDNFHAGPCISRQRYQINALSVQQAKRNGAVAQAVQAAGMAVGIEF